MGAEVGVTVQTPFIFKNEIVLPDYMDSFISCT